MPFAEVCIYQLKPQKAEEFEALMSTVKSFLKNKKDCFGFDLSKEAII